MERVLFGHQYSFVMTCLLSKINKHKQTNSVGWLSGLDMANRVSSCASWAGSPGSLMTIYGLTFNVTPVDLCIIFQCKLFIYPASCPVEIKLFHLFQNWKKMMAPDDVTWRGMVNAVPGLPQGQEYRRAMYEPVIVSPVHLRAFSMLENQLIGKFDDSTLLSTVLYRPLAVCYSYDSRITEPWPRLG